MRATACLLGLVMLVPAWGCQPSPESTLTAINALRAQPTSCGGQPAGVAAPVRWSIKLMEAADLQANQLMRRDRIDHQGSALRTRLHAAGYVMRVAGENLAGGPQTLDEALAQWLASPTHCENLMLADFTEVGLACVSGPGRFERYWVLLLAAPAAGNPARSTPDRSP